MAVSLRGLRVSLLGATGAVGEEILHVLEERRFPVRELRAFASTQGEGRELEFRGELVRVEPIQPARVLGGQSATAPRVDLVLCAAPRVLDADLLDAIRTAGTVLVDVSGALELEPEVPLYLPGAEETLRGAREAAIPRGAAAALALALRPLHEAVGIARVTAAVLESASGAGRRGVGELSDQTVQLLNAMTGEAGESELFPRALAFDCLPLVGELLEGGDANEERRLGHVVRRCLAAPELALACTRVRVPIFGGSLTCASVVARQALSASVARALWEKRPELELLAPEALPTPRQAVGTDRVQIGRIRAGDGADSLSFALAQDDLRRGAALSVVEAAALLAGVD